MIKAILFDLNGVICEDGFKRTPAAYEKEFGVPADIFYAAIHDHQAWKDFSLGLITEIEYLRVCREKLVGYELNSRRYIELVSELTVPNDEVITFLKNELVGKYILGIVSNSPKEWFENFIKKVGLNNIITVKAISSYLHVRKPAKELFEMAVKEADVEPDECLYIDDRPERMDGAIELGVHIFQFDGDIDKTKKYIHLYN